MAIFEPKITLGNIISTFAIVAAGVGVFVDMKVELAILTSDVSHVQTDIIKTSGDIGSLSKSISDLLVASGRQDQILKDVQERQKDQTTK